MGLNDRNQVFTPTAAALFVATGAGLFFYFKSEKEKLLKKKGAPDPTSHPGRP
jgi:protein SCO1/2